MNFKNQYALIALTVINHRTEYAVSVKITESLDNRLLKIDVLVFILQFIKAHFTPWTVHHTRKNLQKEKKSF